jgi:PKD repeat protein
MKNYKFLLIISIFSFLFFSCGESGSGSSDSVVSKPTNLAINKAVIGSSTTMPNGDGTGVVNFTVSANNAKEYKMSVDGEILTSTTGNFTYTFKQSGTNNHTVYVFAYNGDKFISGTTIVTVYVIPKAVFFDEFSVDGAPDSSKWGYDLGNNNGWGNNEAQYYTNRTQNAVVSNGTLKINLIKEAYQGYNYTSARLLSKGKYSMKYGKVEIRAKIPSGGGTWPALWMLGDNIDSVGWPACGEIDIMEHVGNQLNRIFGTLHYPGRSGGNADGASVMIPNATTEFHIYSMEWNASTIKIYVDNQLFFTYNNNPNSPFNQNFFFIMNFAMGGNFGGTIDPNVTNATMEVDYIRVYQ